MENPLVNDRFLLKKMPGKGGWTFAELPAVEPDKSKPFGWVQVRGTIDGFPVDHFKLMPMGSGKLFLSVRAEIRKAIKKKEGDWIEVVLFADDSPLEIPDEFLVCLLDAPNAHAFFEKLTDSNQKYYIDWIFSAKRMETKVDRIAKAIERLENGQKMFE